MRALRAGAIAGIFITVFSIVAICVLNLQYLYSILQSLVPTGCIDAHTIGMMYSFNRSAVLTWTLICVILLIIDLLLALAIKGAADRGEKSAATKLSAIYLGVTVCLTYVSYILYNMVSSIEERCSVNMLTSIRLGNVIVGAIVLASAVACLALSIYESRRLSRPARLGRPPKIVTE
ncbi:MAG: hypothetical protein GXO23_06120 [Crenarchaeota archaeon]|nr:hypothetical protein [Thermoproteota archaeon]